jgi:hypothetical protein
LTTVLVRYHGLLRQLRRPVPEEALALAPGTTLRGLLRVLAGLHGEALEQALFTNEKGISCTARGLSEPSAAARRGIRRQPGRR